MIARLVAMLCLGLCGCATAKAANDPVAPGLPSWQVMRNAGDTFVVRLNYAPGRATTGALWTVRVTATNGTWSGLPNKTPAGASFAVMTVNAIPWDSTTFTPTLWGTNGTLVSKDSTIGPVLKLRRPPGPPTVPGWDTSGTVIGLLSEPPTRAFTSIGQTAVLCAFVQFKDGKVASRTGDKFQCDSIAVRIFTPAQRSVSVMQQLCADTAGYCYNAASGLQTRWLNGVRLSVR